jgi:hypothetical protein
VKKTNESFGKRVNEETVQMMVLVLQAVYEGQGKE